MAIETTGKVSNNIDLLTGTDTSIDPVQALKDKSKKLEDALIREVNEEVGISLNENEKFFEINQ